MCIYSPFNKENDTIRSPAYHVDMASNEKMRARTQLFSHSVELATEREGVLRIGCPDQLHSKPLLGENCLTTVLPDGSRYFIKMRTDEEEMCARDAAAAEQKSKLGLLSQSMRELMKEADRLRIDAITKSKKKPSSTFDTQSKEVCKSAHRYLFLGLIVFSIIYSNICGLRNTLLSPFRRYSNRYVVYSVFPSIICSLFLPCFVVLAAELGADQSRGAARAEAVGRIRVRDARRLCRHLQTEELLRRLEAARQGKILSLSICI